MTVYRTAIRFNICSLAEKAESFVRPPKEDANAVIAFCNGVEDAISKNDNFLDFIKSAELACMLCSIFERGTKVKSHTVSSKMQKAIEIIERDFAEPLTVSKIAGKFNISISYLSRVFKKDTGVSVYSYLLNYRINKATYLLKSHSVTATGYLCGFCDSSHFISALKRFTKQTPMRYKNGNK